MKLRELLFADAKLNTFVSLSLCVQVKWETNRCHCQKKHKKLKENPKRIALSVFFFSVFARNGFVSLLKCVLKDRQLTCYYFFQMDIKQKREKRDICFDSLEFIVRCCFFLHIKIVLFYLLVYFAIRLRLSINKVNDACT